MTGATSSGMVRTLAIAALCFGLGGGTVYWFTRGSMANPAPAPVAGAPRSPLPSTPPVAAGETRLPDLVVPVDPILANRAGLAIEPIGEGRVTTILRVPATVMPNQYQQVQVSSLVGGQLTHVSAELGDRVRQGMPLAQIFSSELADAQTRYLSARAELTAADERLQRTTRLVAIGAASQQELEQTQADRTKLATNMEGEAARLRLFGMPAAAVARLKTAADVSATLTLVSPGAGVVTGRTANPGAVIMPSTPLFVISSTSPVWVIAEVSERDLSRVRVGSSANVLVQGGRAVSGKISYISPDVRPETRTAQVRVETPNPAGDLRFGMLATVELPDAGTAGPARVAVPESAVQLLGGRSFVYVARPGTPGAFVEREVKTGARSASGTIEILEGLTPGESIVTSGSFFIRAERERLGLRPETPGPDAQRVAVKVVQVEVTASGFTPARVEVAAGTHVKLRVTRKVDGTCGTDLVVAGRKITEHLPLNSPVEVDLGVVTRGEVAFSCGMKMLQGAIIVH